MKMTDFKEILWPIKNKLYRFSLRVVGDPTEAEDVVQEVFIKVWNKRSELHQYKNIEAWCMTLTRNLSIDKLRSKHRRTDQLDHQMELRATSATPLQQTEYRDTLDQVKGLIGQLPEKQKMVMHLRDMEGLSYQEIADALQLSMEQVKVNLFRARKFIRTQMLKKETYGL